MEWLTEPFSQPFLQRALLAGILAVITTSLVGTWVVLRGLSFMGDALAHGVLPGIAVALLLGIDPTLGAIASALVMVAGIGLVHRQSSLSDDTSIGLLFVGMLALGVIIISRSAGFAGELTSILFGDILGVSKTDIALQAVAALVTLIVVAALYRPFLALSFNESKAQVLGLFPKVAHLMMLALIGLAVVTSFQTVGTLLVFGLLVAPPATGVALHVRNVPMMMATAVGVGVASVIGGLVISYHADTAAAPTMAAVAVGIFFVALFALEPLAVRRHGRPGGPGAGRGETGTGSMNAV